MSVYLGGRKITKSFLMKTKYLADMDTLTGEIKMFSTKEAIEHFKTLVDEYENQSEEFKQKICSYMNNLTPYQRKMIAEKTPLVILRIENNEEHFHCYPDYREVIKIWDSIKHYNK